MNPNPDRPANILSKINNDNLKSTFILDKYDDWDIYTQDGPSDETMLVNHENKIAITQDDIFGYRLCDYWIFETPACGWYKIGKL